LKSAMSKQTEAAEFKTSKLWDRCIENALVKTGYGLVGAGLAAALFFRHPASRAAVTAFGAGVGAGISWMEARATFENPNTKLSSFRMPGSQPKVESAPVDAPAAAPVAEAPASTSA